jgi:hypothetical protein
MSLSEIVTQAYKEKNISGRCELCGHTDWGISENLQNLVFANASGEGEQPVMTQMPVAILTCNHCGNMRIHARRVLEKA